MVAVARRPFFRRRKACPFAAKDAPKTNKHNEVFGKKTATLIITECEIGPPEQSMPTRPG